MLFDHYDEIAQFKEISAIKPLWERYLQIEEAGNLIALVAKDADHVIGYSITFLMKNMHYGDLKFAQNDLLYLRPEYRKGKLGLKLMEATILCAKDHGAKLMVWHAKKNTALDALLPRLGYDVLDTLWAKRI